MSEVYVMVTICSRKNMPRFVDCYKDYNVEAANISFGKLWKDVELGDFEIPHLHSAVGNEFDGEPDMPIRKPFKILTDKLKNPYEFHYMMLSRLQSDCEYYLNYGNRCTGRLYYHDESKQIDAMKKLWQEFPDDGKPVWLTWEQILEYEKAMCPAIK